MRKQLIISAGAIIAILAMAAPALAQVPFGAPFGACGPGPAGCGFGVPFGLAGCGFGLPFGVSDGLVGIVGLGLAMIDSVLSAAFGCIGLGLGAFGGFGFPFGCI